MAVLKACDIRGCKVVGQTGPNGNLKRVSRTVTPGGGQNPFRAMTVMWHLCPEHEAVADDWAEKVSGQMDFSELEAPESES